MSSQDQHHGSQTLTSLLTNLVQDLAGQINGRVDILAEAVNDLKGSIPVQPCAQHQDLKARVTKMEEENASFDKQQEKIHEDRRKFWNGIISKVLGTLILAALLYVWDATRTQVIADVNATETVLESK